MKPLIKILSLLLSVVLIVGVLTVIPVNADTVDDVTYIDEHGDIQTVSGATRLTSDLSVIIRDDWYVVDSDVEFDERMNAAGDVHIILRNGCTLTAHKGITVPKSRNVTRSLTIYAQSTDAEEMGAIVIDDVAQDNPGIGNTSVAYGHGIITVNGGKITVTGGRNGAGIGGGSDTKSSGVTVNGGIVNATGGRSGAGIGGGSNAGSDVTINGGIVNATGGSGAAGVGSGYLNSTDHAAVTITGGTVNATGAAGGAGIGSGRTGSGSSYPLDSDCDVKISGGSITATGVNGGAGIGGGLNSKGSVEITGGTVSATAMNTGGGDTVGSGVGNGFNTSGSRITLSWTDLVNDNYYADSYKGSVMLQKFFTDRGTELYTPGTAADNGMIGGKTIYPSEATVKKIWEIGSNRTLRPDSVKIALQVYKSPGSSQPEKWTTDKTVILNADGNWKTDLSDYTSSDGKSYRARVRELDSDDKPVYAQGDPEYQENDDDEDKRPVVVYSFNSEGKKYKLNYRVTYAMTGAGRITVTNEMDERKFKIEKKWDIDLENLDRPDSIQVLAQAKDGSQWKNEQIVTLSKDNDWKAELCAPKYRYEGAVKKEIEYRIRELKEESIYNQFMSGIKDLVIQGKSTYDEWTSKLKTEGQSIYNALPEDVRNAMNDSYESLCETLGVADDKVNELYDKLMDILERESAGIRVIHDKNDDDKGEKEVTNRVNYNVPERTSVVNAGKVDAHLTTYQVKYDENDDDITVTNKAIVVIDMFKWWLNIGVDEEDMPDSAWLVLMCDPKEGALDNAKDIASAAGIDLGGVLDFEFPVIDPIEGGNGPLGIISEVVAGVDLGFLDDLFSLPDLAIVKVDEDCKWRTTIVDAKYTCGIPKEYRAAELSGEIIHQIIKYGTDGVVDIPVSYNPFDNYITLSTKAYPELRFLRVDDLMDTDMSEIIEHGKSISQQDLDNLQPQDLVLDKTRMMANVINFKIDWDSDDDDDNELSGSKTWVGDTEEKRPDWIKIHIKDGADEIEGSPVTLNKDDFTGENTWEWSLDLDDDDDDDATYTVSEEYPEDYAYIENYTCTRSGMDLTNTWHDSPPETTTIAGQKIWKDSENAQDTRPESITVNLLADGEKASSVTVDATCEWKYFFPNKPVYRTDENNQKVKIVYTVTEESVEGYDTQVDGFNIINSLHTEACGKLTITATRPDPAKAKEQSFVYNVSGPDNTALIVMIVLPAGETTGSVTVAKLPSGSYTVTEESAWSWRYSDAGSKDAIVGNEPAEVTFDHTLNKTEWLSGCSHRKTEKGAQHDEG